tara:strand:- start:102 stop:473 length:372 start_codon:yes stop_codon:yes gene_type:complete
MRVLIVILFIFNGFSASAAELLMLEEEGCGWCEAWDEEVGQAYNKTELGKLLPLKKLDIDSPTLSAYKLLRPVMFTPTFIVVDGSSEVGRITGYLGDYQFWSLLEELIIRVPLTRSPNAEPVS